MTQGRTIEELDLLAYADGLLDPLRREEVAAYLRENPQAAQRVADYESQNRIIRAAYDHTVTEPLPDRLAAALEPRPAPPFWRRSLRYGAFAASLAAAGFLGWSLKESSVGPPQPSQALVEASLALHSDWSPKPEVAASNVDSSALIPKAVAAEQEGDVTLRIPTPDLSPLGLRLVGMRGTDERGIPGVQLIYTDGAGERTSLFLLPGAGGTPPAISSTQQDSGTLAYWREGPITFALTGRDAGRSAQSVAAQVRGALRGAPITMMPPTGGGMTAETGESTSGGMDNVPLLTPLPASDITTGSEAM
ncbi:anti-sigma factor family protein [Aquibaculum sediminis]|uniref:anti-sigma factor family protein n=1 Tax=Aquibaculum sediminis TaxID=3231907 RepID=UPI003451821D